MEATQLRKEFEEKGYSSLINSDIYPDGKIYTKEYTEFLETKLLKIKSEVELLKEAKQVLLQIDLRNNGKCYNNGVLDNCQCTLCKINKFLENADG